MQMQDTIYIAISVLFLLVLFPQSAHGADIYTNQNDVEIPLAVGILTVFFLAIVWVFSAVVTRYLAEPRR